MLRRGTFAMLAVAALLALPQVAAAYTFGPTVTALGPQQAVFDASTTACDYIDIPDNPARAFRDASGQVQLISSHFLSRRMIGPDLDHLRQDCDPIMSSHFDADPANFADYEWMNSPYTTDGSTIYALVVDEYHGEAHPGMCPAPYDYRTCRFTSVVLAISTDGGRTYVHKPGPSSLVASLPYPYAPGSTAYGVLNPSNIVYRPEDGHYYILARVEQYKAQQSGACLLRSSNLSDPASWRAWDGSGFNVRFVDPYLEPAAYPPSHVCAPVAPSAIAKMAMSVTYNTYFGAYLLVGYSAITDPTTGVVTKGAFYSLSKDLINWSPRQLLMKALPPFDYDCGPDKPITYPTLLDPGSPSRNFETTGQRPYLYFTQSNFTFVNSSCFQNLNRDLVRIPIQFNGTGTAAASLASSAAVASSKGASRQTRYRRTGGVRRGPAAPRHARASIVDAPAK
jgi:hypothetical protein